MSIQAKVILDSNMNNERIITIMTYSPKFLDGECEKHRNIESNSSSSRAMSFPATQRQDELFIPPWVQKPTRNMHGSEEVNIENYQNFENALKLLFDKTIELLHPFKSEVHKQTLNRYIEPFMMQTKVMTANLFAWENFIKLRTSKYADPNIQILALEIEAAIEASKPVNRTIHLPLITAEDKAQDLELSQLCMISAGRVAKVSYGVINDELASKSISRALELIALEHKTPFTHQAFSSVDMLEEGVSHTDEDNFYSSAFRNVVQLRKVIWQSLDEGKTTSGWISLINSVRKYEAELKSH